MDDFLTKMYEDEMEKTSAVELDNFMDSLPVDELEALLEIEGGIEKVAVAGPVEAPMPDSLPGNELDSQMSAVDEYAIKMRTETPPTRKQTAEPTAVSHQGPGKQVSKEAMAMADSVGRMMAKTAAGDISVRAGDAWAPPLDPEEGARQGRLGGRISGGLLGAAYGGMAGAHLGKRHGTRAALAGGLGGVALGGLGLGYLGGKGGEALGRKSTKDYARRVQSDIAALQKMREKKSQGFGEGGEGEMETTAAIKAKIAERALRVTAGAPPHIKQAAAKMAALQITAACEKVGQIEGEMEKEDAFTTPEAKAKSRMMAKAMKLGKGKPAAARKGLVSAMGKKL